MRTPSVLLAGAGLVLVAAMPASAADPGQIPAAAAAHCVVTAQDINTTAESAPERCYSTFAEAIMVAADAGQVLGIEYDRKAFGGWSLVIIAESPACADGHTYGVPRLPVESNNMISSARSYAGCTAIHWSRADYKGDRVNCGCSVMRGMNDRTSSILFTPGSAGRR